MRACLREADCFLQPPCVNESFFAKTVQLFTKLYNSRWRADWNETSEWIAIWIDWFITAKETTELPSRNRTRMYRSLQMLGTWFPSSKRIFYSAWMSDRYIPGVYQVYTYHITYAAILLAFLVSQARPDVSDLDFLRISSVLATESSPTLGWGLPKFHIQSLIS